MSPILVAVALSLATPAPSALVAIDTVRVVAFSGTHDILEAVALKAGIVKQNPNMRL